MLEWERNTLTALSKSNNMHEAVDMLVEMGDENVIKSRDKICVVKFRIDSLGTRLMHHRDWVEDADKLIADSHLLQEKMW